MKTTRITDENGCTHATNWMLDDIIEIDFNDALKLMVKK